MEHAITQDQHRRKQLQHQLTHFWNQQVRTLLFCMFVTTVTHASPALVARDGGSDGLSESQSALGPNKKNHEI